MKKLLADLRALDPWLSDLSDSELIAFLGRLQSALDEPGPAKRLESADPPA